MTGDPSYARPGDNPAAEPYPAGEPGGRTEPYPAAEPSGRAEPYPAGEPSGPAVPDERTGTAGPAPELTIEHTRTGGLWVVVTAAALVILLLLIFILQNTEQVEVALFGANPNLPLGVALLLAAVLGALTVALVGTARIVQLRHIAKRHRDADRRTRG